MTLELTTVLKDGNQHSVEYDSLQEFELVYYEVHPIVRRAHPQTVNLTQYGIKIYVPPNAFLEQLMNITIGIDVSGNFIWPENTTLVSANYYINTSSILLQPLTLEIEHCVSVSEEHQTSNLIFGKADTEGTMPYLYNKISNGTFQRGQTGGIIQMSSFCWLGIFWCDDSPPVAYTATVLTHQNEHRAYRLLLIAVRDIGVSKKVQSTACSPVSLSILHYIAGFFTHS